MTTQQCGALRVPMVLGYAGSIIMLLIVAYALVFGDLMHEGALLLDMPWGVVSLLDIYVGLVLFSSWVIWREKNMLRGLTWAVSILLLGNMVSCVYVLKAAYKADGYMLKFWLGNRYIVE